MFYQFLKYFVRVTHPRFRVFFRSARHTEGGGQKERGNSIHFFIVALRSRRMLRAQPSRTSGHFRFPRDKKERGGYVYTECRRMGHPCCEIKCPLNWRFLIP